MRWFEAYGLSNSMPIYTTREDANRESATYSLSLWMTLMAIFLIWANIIIWSLIGLFVAVRVIV